DNFFKAASYTIEALCAKSFEDTSEKLKEIESQILRKRNELRLFETEYRKPRAYYVTTAQKNEHHRRSVAASLVQGVYVLERDRQENRQGPYALAS
ncbi:hypothetical protein IFM89_026101, partial [Coptis chinensis]